MKINVYDTKTGAQRCRLAGHEGGVWALQYYGNVLVSGSTDRTVRVWDIARGQMFPSLPGPYFDSAMPTDLDANPRSVRPLTESLSWRQRFL